MLKPQDILVALAILVLKDKLCRQSDIASTVHISVSEVNASIKRLIRANLVEPGLANASPKVLISALKEFLIHGLKYAFPAEIGRLTRGIPTSYAAPAFKNTIVFNENDAPVWPDANGKARGYSITPLYRSATSISNSDIYMFLSLIDAIRAGKARERNIGIKLIEERLDEYRTS